GAGCSRRGCSCPSSWPKASSGRTSTWRGRPTTTAARRATSRAAVRVFPSGLCSPYSRTSPHSPDPSGLVGPAHLLAEPTGPLPPLPRDADLLERPHPVRETRLHGVVQRDAEPLGEATGRGDVSHRPTGPLPAERHQSEAGDGHECLGLEIRLDAHARVAPGRQVRQVRRIRTQPGSSPPQQIPDTHPGPSSLSAPVRGERSLTVSDRTDRQLA